MGDSREEKGESAEKNSKSEIVTSQETENKPGKKSITKIFSDEIVEQVHDSVESKSSVVSASDDVKDRTVPKEEAKDKVIEEPIRKEYKKLENENTAEAHKTDIHQEKQRFVNSALSCPREAREKIIRNQSDIFSLKEVPTTLQTSIFSVNGCPSRKLFRKQEPPGHLFQRNDDPPADKVTSPRVNRITKENYNDEKRPSSSYRNPLTGSGLSSNDEYKSTGKGSKRKDGNPLLGLGYDSEVTKVTSQHRIPPGGYSHKLW